MAQSNILKYIEEMVVRERTPTAALVDVRLLRHALETMELELIAKCKLEELKEILDDNEYERKTFAQRWRNQMAYNDFGKWIG